MAHHPGTLRDYGAYSQRETAVRIAARSSRTRRPWLQLWSRCGSSTAFRSTPLLRFASVEYAGVPAEPALLQQMHDPLRAQAERVPPIWRFCRAFRPVPTIACCGLSRNI